MAGLHRLALIVALFSTPVFANGASESKVRTVEDVQGESKSRFRAAIGIVNFEKADDTVPDPVAS